MPPKSKPLTSQQRSVLEWIQDGRPDGVYTSGYEHRIVAKGLERRGFVKISGRGKTWTAKIRPAGKERLSESAPEEPDPVDLSEAGELLRQVTDAGGELHVAEDDPRDFKDLIEQSLKSSLQPHGKKLVHLGGYGRPWAVVLVDHIDELVEAAPVPVLERVGRYHPSVKRFKERRDIQRVSQEHVQRAALILQSIANEAQRRGIEVVTHDAAKKDRRLYVSDKEWGAHLLLKIADDAYTVQIRETSGKGGQKLPAHDWRALQKLPGWMRKRGYEFIPTGRLDLVVDGRFTGYQGTHYRDNKRQKIEERLPEVFRQFEIYRRQAEQVVWIRAKEEAREEEQRARNRAKAREEYLEVKRWEHFRGKSQHWQKLRQHREFLDLARHAAQDLDEEAQADVLKMLDEAEAHMNEMDPLRHPEQLRPAIPEPTGEDLRPYLPREPIFSWWKPEAPGSPTGRSKFSI